MTPRTLFTIILRIFGIAMIYNLINIIPSWITKFPISTTHGSSMVVYILAITIVFASYSLIIWASLFKTGWIINKLKLDKNFDQETVNINVEGVAILQIAFIVTGVTILIYSIPDLFSDFIYYSRLKDTIYSSDKTTGLSLEKIWSSVSLSMTIFNFGRILLGALLLTFNRWLSNWISRKSNKKESSSTVDERLENREE